MKQGIIVPKEELEAFGRRVRSIREHLRLKQNEFAAGLELSVAYICQIEKGKGNPTYEFFYKLVSKYKESGDGGQKCIIRSYPTTNSVFIRPPIPFLFDHRFRWVSVHFLLVLRNEWTE